jgi:hypothetical protein
MLYFYNKKYVSDNISIYDYLKSIKLIFTNDEDIKKYFILFLLIFDKLKVLYITIKKKF